MFNEFQLAVIRTTRDFAYDPDPDRTARLFFRSIERYEREHGRGTPRLSSLPTLVPEALGFTLN